MFCSVLKHFMLSPPNARLQRFVISFGHELLRSDVVEQKQKLLHHNSAHVNDWSYIGLGYRHLSNIMIQRGTGGVIHIDFGDSFEVAMNRESYPEKVPFRLPRMIVNALDGGTVHGLFKRMCEDVMWVLREN